MQSDPDTVSFGTHMPPTQVGGPPGLEDRSNIEIASQSGQ